MQFRIPRSQGARLNGLYYELQTLSRWQ